MANTVYDNFVLANMIEDQFKSYLDLQNFCIVDDTLTGNVGMKYTVHKYSATDGTEKLTMGNGNTKDIGVSFSTKDYNILLAQNRFKWYDEQNLKDDYVVTTGVQHSAVDMFNTVNTDIFAAFNEATLAVTGTPGFDIFVDGLALLNSENVEGEMPFAFVSPADLAKLRKALKDELKYVEDFARTGYVGTVAGVNLYTKKDATAGTVVLATPEAVTLFNRSGVEVEQDRDIDKRENTLVTRKYYVAALTNATKAVKLTFGSTPPAPGQDT